MQWLSVRALLRLGRLTSLVLFAILGTSALMYWSPGYFADAREMDGQHASSTRAELDRLKEQQGSLASLLSSEAGAWCHGNLGQSREFGLPVSTLLQERALPSLRLLASGVLAGWSIAVLFAIPLSLRRSLRADAVITTCTALVLALPVGVLATVCLVANFGGPSLVLAAVVAVRDFKLLYRILQQIWRAPFLLHAEAQGLTRTQILRTHIGLILRRELMSLCFMSFTLALSVLVPVEVVFDVPGLGHMAWNAAMNRDLPVLVGVTLVMATCVGFAGL